MSGLNENKSGIVRPSSIQGSSRMGDAKSVHNHRRALGNINHNIMGATNYHCVVHKRVVSGKDIICTNNASMSMNMPITRKFAVEPLSNQQQCIGGQEDYGDASDDPIPVFVRHTEVMLDEIDCIDEVEMEDVEEDPILDIDCRDFNNPLAVVEYVDDIYAYYRKNEIYSCVSPNYMVHQFDINEKMRAILIDWLIEVHYKFELMDETIFLTVNLIDRFLDQCTVARKKLQLVGVTAMLLASKYEEVSVPMVEDFVLISDKAYTRRDVLDMEKLMVNTLQFNMSVPTSYVFMRRFLKAAQSDRKLELLSFFIMELCLVEYEMLKFTPSLLAAASIYTAQCSLHKSTQWSKTSEWHTKYSENQLLECSKLMATLHQKAGTGKLTGVYRKYSTSKFGYAAKTEPAQFLLDFWQC